MALTTKLQKKIIVVIDRDREEARDIAHEIREFLRQNRIPDFSVMPGDCNQEQIITKLRYIKEELRLKLAFVFFASEAKEIVSPIKSVYPKARFFCFCDRDDLMKTLKEVTIDYRDFRPNNNTAINYLGSGTRPFVQKGLRNPRN